MKILYWNVRGIANSPSRLALRRLINLNNPDFVFLAEPWMNFNAFPATWLTRLNLKIFAFNSRDNNLPNLWCICSIHLNPIVIHSDDQQVTFKFLHNNKEFFFSVVYASTSNLQRKKLWQTQSYLQSSYSAAPWCFIGDFNTILGAREHFGVLNPARPPIAYFHSWTDSNSLLHLPTRDAFYTWDNNRSGRRHVKRRLDRSICNQNMIDSAPPYPVPP